MIVNSPGGSPVQSNLLFKRIRQMAAEQKKRVYVFCEDVAASGGYFLAIAGDEIYADPSSIIGSIGAPPRCRLRNATRSSMSSRSLSR